MEAKCFLSRAYKLHREIQIKKEQLASIRESLSSITNPIDKEHVSHTPDSSPMENALMTGDFPVLKPGMNAISWSGAVTKVVVRPNWRSL